LPDIGYISVCKRLHKLINTFKRPAQALAVIECLRATSSGKHEVKYVVAYDKEDWMTDQFFPPASREHNPPAAQQRPAPRRAARRMQREPDRRL
jgi:hypothetical protein